MPKLSVGARVPEFSLPACGGGTWSLRDAAGAGLVLYFYPRDLTSGCTRQAQEFRDHHPAFRKAGVQIVGISRDSLASHARFVAKEKLPYPLLADTEERVCRLFDVIKEKSLYGRKYLGVERSTFLLDGAGRLRREWRNVKVPGHVEEVLEAAQRI
ncbi:MAG: peroxiredoxin [Gammaproteobacteria bacterium]|nr:peroxiredoxin [Gammaproteobacteria bacterium]